MERKAISLRTSYQPTFALVNTLYDALLEAGERRVADYFTTTNACSCPDFRYRGRLRPCKHISALVDAYALIRAVLRKWESISTSASSAGG